jgi:hypothetical protein
MSSPPTGTFQATNKEGPTELGERSPDAVCLASAGGGILRRVTKKREGRSFKTVGDALCCAFSAAASALEAAFWEGRTVAPHDTLAYALDDQEAGSRTGARPE